MVKQKFPPCTHGGDTLDQLDIPKGSAGHGEPMLEPEERSKKKGEAERTSYVGTINSFLL